MIGRRQSAPPVDDGVARPLGIAATANHAARASGARAEPTNTLCHATPPSINAPTTSGADSAPTLKKRWSRFIARPRPVRKRSRYRPFDPPSRPPPPRPASSADATNRPHVGARPKLAIPSAVEDRRGDEDAPPADALRERPAAERAGGVGARVQQVDEPDPRVALGERRLDRPDRGRDEQPGPADREERQAAQNGGR